MRRSLPAFVLALALVACRDLSSFTTGGDRFEGPVVPGDFVRAGVPSNVRACLTLDTDHLQDAPGRISSSDGRFHEEPLRPIPQIWHDPLSTLSFGDGRQKNLVYVATPVPSFAGDPGGEVFVVVSLMNSGSVEVRLLRGAPGGDASTPTGAPSNIFAVFTLDRQPGPCSF
jgi:hypothetical protein